MVIRTIYNGQFAMVKDIKRAIHVLEKKFMVKPELTKRANFDLEGYLKEAAIQSIASFIARNVIKIEPIFTINGTAFYKYRLNVIEPCTFQEIDLTEFLENKIRRKEK